jgi:hypothetical protein
VVRAYDSTNPMTDAKASEFISTAVVDLCSWHLADAAVPEEGGVPRGCSRLDRRRARPTTWGRRTRSRARLMGRESWPTRATCLFWMERRSKVVERYDTAQEAGAGHARWANDTTAVSGAVAGYHLGDSGL